ncbi:MAG: hypothetical protein JWN22_2897 [Nocardioides sp.]|jgi:hypothetical protein|nr:hypothetical protein [Nocardioides sp.]
MAKDEPGNDGPSLELPSLGFGRKRRKKGTAPEAETPVQAEAVADPEAEATTLDAPAPAPADHPTEVLAPARAPVREPARTPPPVPEPVSAPPLFADEVETPPSAEPVEAAAPQDPEPDDPKPRRKARPRRELPLIGGMAASVLTGVLVGIITVGLTWGSLHLCEVVQGTSSCGNPGYALLAAILVVAIVLGALMLKAWGVPDPGSTSFLAVGLLAVLALIFLVDVLFSWTMIIVIPVIAALTYAVSHWVTTAFIEPADH